MKKLIYLNQLIFFIFLSATVLISCGTEEDAANETLELTLSEPSVQVDNTIIFQVSSSISGDVTAQSEFFVNGTQIAGNTYIPTEANENNEVYAIYDGKTTTTKIFASFESTPSAFTQKVLVEDYTGTWCGWCPRMQTIINYLTDYSDNIIPVAIHTTGSPIDPWLYEHAGQMMSAPYYDTGGAPAGQVNRIHKLNQDAVANPCPNNADFFRNEMDPYLNQTAPLGLSIGSTLSGNNITMNVKVGFATGNVTNPKLVVYLIEEGLVYAQYNYFSGNTTVSCDPEYDYTSMPNPIPNHPQDHVLLRTYTDIYGDSIPQDQVSEGSIWTWEQTFPLPANITNAQNLSIVAFVLGNGDSIKTNGVLNVQSAHINSFQDFD